MKRSLLLSGGLGEVLLYSPCTLCISTLDARLTQSFRETRWLCGWGVAVSLKDSLTEVEGADGLTLAPTGDLSASGQSLQSCNRTNYLTLKYHKMNRKFVLMKFFISVNTQTDKIAH